MVLTLHYECYYFFLYNFSRSKNYLTYQKTKIAFFCGWRKYLTKGIYRYWSRAKLWNIILLAHKNYGNSFLYVVRDI